MSIIADLHIHSKYSRAVSQKMDLDGIAEWASRKGIKLVATGDWTHPIWYKTIKTQLREVWPGIYVLRKKPISQKSEVYFILATEVSSIYSQGGKSRRIHNLIFSPSLEVAEKVNRELYKRGVNLLSDGRPIMGISSKDLLSLLLEIDKNIVLIPCHIWTPWFSLFGSKSGFDSIEESYGELSQHIYGIETGLSSDPIMNWQINELKNRSILSSSDAHSGPKLGREATVFINSKQETVNKMFTYKNIVDAIRQDPNGKLKIGYTIEFFPEEGKYHWSGHRSCGIRYSPKEVLEKGEICPICKNPLTIGVENRVIELSEKIIEKQDLVMIQNNVGLTFVYDKDKKRKPFVSAVPLMEILTEIMGGSQAKAYAEYCRITDNASEFDILLKKTYEKIADCGGSRLAQAIRIMRERKTYVDPGYDGVFGKVQIFHNQTESKSKNSEEEDGQNTDQPSLF